MGCYSLFVIRVIDKLKVGYSYKKTYRKKPTGDFSLLPSAFSLI